MSCKNETSIKEFKINWVINIKDEGKLIVNGNATYSDEFTENEINQIQKLYKEAKITKQFRNCIKIDFINYKYRDSLKLHLENKDKEDKKLGFIMFNPSFASPDKPDDTARNAIKFAKKQGYNNITILNLLPIRISNAKIVGRYYEEHNGTFENDCLTKEELENLPDEIVICWGKLPKNIKNINNIIENLEKLLSEKTLYQITEENFQRHLSSPSINKYGGINKLELTKIKNGILYKFDNPKVDT